jgi:hypothetical protein
MSQVTAASIRLGTIASSVSAAVGESNVQAASATVSSIGAKTRGAVSSTVSFLEEKGVVSGAQGLVASAGATAKSVFAFAQSGVRRTYLFPPQISYVSFIRASGKGFGEIPPTCRKIGIFQMKRLQMPAASR